MRFGDWILCAPRRRSAKRTAVIAAAALALGCGRGSSGGAAGSAAASASGAPRPADVLPGGPTVSIPAGTLKAGTPCGLIPRVTTEELVGDEIQLPAFQIDVFPYPNDPAKPARVEVSRDEAAGLCAAAGKRLCTELEWERACKGPGNTTFEYGQAFNQTSCKVEADLLPDKRPKCVSAFGVKDMHGLVFEWTSSAWGRGSSGDLATVRGGYGTGVTLQARCANGQSRAPGTQAKDVGFRCCSGPPSPAVVSLSLQKQPPMVEEPAVDASLAAAMLKAMPLDHRTVKDTDVGFDKLWRWHPRDNEELLLARWTGKPKDRTKNGFSELAVFKVCGSTPGLVARMRGPVATLGKPGAGADAQKASVEVATGKDKAEVKLAYWYGAVQVEQPTWIKGANSVDTGDAPKPPIVLRLPRPRGK